MKSQDPEMIKLGSELQLIRGMYLVAKLEEISALFLSLFLFSVFPYGFFEWNFGSVYVC